MTTPEIRMTERELMQQTIDLAESFGWLVYHTHDSRRSQAGFPDLVMVRNAELLAIECKTTVGKVTDAQRRWLEAFAQVKVVSSFVLRPPPTDDDASELIRMLR